MTLLLVTEENIDSVESIHGVMFEALGKALFEIVGDDAESLEALPGFYEACMSAIARQFGHGDKLVEVSLEKKERYRERYQMALRQYLGHHRLDFGAVPVVLDTSRGIAAELYYAVLASNQSATLTRGNLCLA
ncbi:MAG: hypothetical protein PHW75_02880 [Patescibacteria group bacterium]|nr:hypothetical protein [Patescibacteria group bacterium]